MEFTTSIQKLKARLKTKQAVEGGYLPKDNKFTILMDFIQKHENLEDYVLQDAVYNRK
jgi:hypothetical protein